MDKGTSKLFPSDLCGRLALGIASFFFVPLSAVGVFASFFRSQPQTLTEWIILAFVDEICTALALFFGCGLIWAVATPRWLEKYLLHVTGKLILALLFFMIPFTVVALWALMNV